MPTTTEITLEAELAGLVAAAKLRGRQARAVSRRLGLDGLAPSTLAAAADPEGYSRERVRQLEMRLRAHVENARPDAPATTAAVRLLERATPIARTDAGRALVDAGIADAPFDPAGVIAAASLLGVRHDLQEHGELVLRGEGVELAVRADEIARRVVRRRGAATVADVAAELGPSTPHAVVRRLLSHGEGVTWLDDHGKWFVVDGLGTRVTRGLRKMLTVSARLTLAEIEGGLRRCKRPVYLPRTILRRVCSTVSWASFDRSRDVLTAATELDPETNLSPFEQALVELFRSAGPTLTYGQARRLGRRDGLNPSTIGVYLSRTPVVQPLGDGRYALRGRAALLAA